MHVSAEGLPFRPAIQIDIAHARVFEPTLLHARVDPDIIMDDDDALTGAAPGFWRELKREYEAVGATPSVHLPFHGLNLGSRSRSVRELSMRLLSAGLRAAAELGAVSAVMHTGFVPLVSRKAAGKWLEAFLPSFDRLLGEAEALGIPLALENTWERTPALFERIGEAVGRRFRYCLDTGHCSVYSELSISEWADFMGDDLAVLHLHDNDGREDLHLPPGRGTLDFRPIAPVILERRPRVVFETKPRHLRQELAFLGALLGGRAAARP